MCALENSRNLFTMRVGLVLRLQTTFALRILILIYLTRNELMLMFIVYVCATLAKEM